MQHEIFFQIVSSFWISWKRAAFVSRGFWGHNSDAELHEDVPVANGAKNLRKFERNCAAKKNGVPLSWCPFWKFLHSQAVFLLLILSLYQCKVQLVAKDSSIAMRKSYWDVLSFRSARCDIRRHYFCQETYITIGQMMPGSITMTTCTWNIKLDEIGSVSNAWQREFQPLRISPILIYFPLVCALFETSNWSHNLARAWKLSCSSLRSSSATRPIMTKRLLLLFLSTSETSMWPPTPWTTRLPDSELFSTPFMRIKSFPSRSTTIFNHSSNASLPTAEKLSIPRLLMMLWACGLA